jgi:hypothetical protein
MITTRTWALQDSTSAKTLAQGSSVDRLQITVTPSLWFEGNVAQEEIEVIEESKRLGDDYLYTLLTVLD